MRNVRFRTFEMRSVRFRTYRLLKVPQINPKPRYHVVLRIATYTCVRLCMTTDQMQKILDSASKAKRKDKATPTSPTSSAKKKKTIATVAAAPVVGKTREESGNPTEEEEDANEDDAWSPYPMLVGHSSCGGGQMPDLDGL
eukprot:COSAG02_NODE_3386_length_6833_cov_57.757945_1_plen_141_part_00